MPASASAAFTRGPGRSTAAIPPARPPPGTDSPAAAVSVRPAGESAGLVHLVGIQPLVAGARVLPRLVFDPAVVRFPGRLFAAAQGRPDLGPRRPVGPSRAHHRLAPVAGLADDYLAERQQFQGFRAAERGV